MYVSAFTTPHSLYIEPCTLNNFKCLAIFSSTTASYESVKFMKRKILLKVVTIDQMINNR
jgi:hypothetical protein